MSIAEAVLSVLASGGCGAAAWAFLDWLMVKVPALASWDTLSKRALAWALCIVFVALLYGTAVIMEWLPMPTTWRAWAQAIGDYALIAITVSQAAHAVDRDKAK